MDTFFQISDKFNDSRYLGINCACFTPNEGRKEDILHLVKEYNADGVMFISLKI